MIIAGELQLQTWKPKGASDWNWRDWTRLKCDQIELSNCVEFTDWDRDPLEPIVCEVCGTSGCGPAGIAHLVRTDNQLLWMQPYDSFYYETEADLKNHSIADTVMINRAEWDWIASQSSHLPQFESIRRINSLDLLQLWRQQLPNCVKPMHGDSYARHFRMNCIAGHPLDLDAALPILLPLHECRHEFEEPLLGEFIEIEPADESVQSFFFDDDTFAEWRAFSIKPPHDLVIASRWVLLAR